MNRDSDATALPAMQPASSLPNTLHRSCQTLPLSHFLEIILNGDLRWLVTNGSPTHEELAAAWEDILQEYISLVKTDKSDNIFDLYKKIKQVEWQLVFVEECLKLLKLQYDEEVADLLGARGFGTVNNSPDREEYLRSLYAIEMGAKVLIVLRNQHHAEYKLLNKGNTEDKLSPSEMRFRYEKEIAMLSKYQGQRIIKEKITVLEYAAIINNYLEEQRANKKEVPDGR